MRGRAGAVAGLILLAPAAANAMSVTDFLAKADALRARGILAALSPDIALLKAVVEDAGAHYRADASSRPPRSCPPAKGQGRVDSTEVIAAFRAIPLAQRSTTTVRVAFTDFMVGRFPCR